jgi:hypothetical protein
MKKTLQKKRKLRSKKTKTRKRYKGGSYYAYNNNPMRFTRSTTQQGGGLTLNTSDTLLPQGLVNIGRSFMFNSSNNTYSGSYPSVNPDPASQPISKSYMLGK